MQIFTFIICVTAFASVPAATPTASTDVNAVRNVGPGTCNPNNQTPGYYQCISQSNHTASPSGLHSSSWEHLATCIIVSPWRIVRVPPLYIKWEDPCPCSCFKRRSKNEIEHKKATFHRQQTNEPTNNDPPSSISLYRNPIGSPLGFLPRGIGTPDCPTRMGCRNNAVPSPRSLPSLGPMCRHSPGSGKTARLSHVNRTSQTTKEWWPMCNFECLGSHKSYGAAATSNSVV